ncbi:MAG: 50S ribosomal protein L11 methyltransferase [Chloroflexi bacterium]|nr:50S ribosomal protein L11 methyltransferase [Chloroflexota bacterium]
MHWVKLSIDSPPEFVEPLTQVFTEHGEGGVAIELPGGHNPDEGESAPVPERVTVTTYIPHDNRLENRYARIDTAVRLVAHVGDVSELRVRVVEEEEWQESWKEHFHVLRVGTRTVIVPTWRTYEPREDDIVIAIDPGMAFGTGHHPTSRMCLELLETRVQPRDRVLDLGCGSGILSIAAAKLGAAEVFGLEIDPIAASVAGRNVRENAVQDTVTTDEASLPHPQAAANGYDLLVANVSAMVITELADHIVRVVRSGGTLIFSGILDKQQTEVIERMTALGGRFDDGLTDADWVALVGRVG